MAQSDNILDAPAQRSSEEKPVYKWLRRIVIAIEIGLWLIGAIALLFKFESWEGGSEMLILAFTALAAFYLLFSFLIAGARGWQQILGAVGVGFSLSLLFVGAIFTIESWPLGREMLSIGLAFGIISVITTLLFLIKARHNGEKVGYHWHVLARLGIILLIVM